MVDKRIRVDRDKMKWHINHYRRQGYEVVNVEIAPSGRIKHACLQNENERIILTPKLRQKINMNSWRRQGLFDNDK